MSATPNYYRILRVQPDAPASLIEASYRMLLQQAQAAGGDRTLLDAAFAVLGDAARRAAYDRLLNEQSASTSQTGRMRGIEDTGGFSLLATCLFCGTPHGLQRAFESDDQCGCCASPLCPATRQRLEVSGQRMLSRIPKQHAIALFAAWPQNEPFVAEMRDLSLNGMQFVTAVHLHQNQIVKIDCAELQAVARVAYASLERQAPEAWLTGVEFLTLRFRQNLGSFVSARV